MHLDCLQSGTVAVVAGPHYNVKDIVNVSVVNPIVSYAPTILTASLSPIATVIVGAVKPYVLDYSLDKKLHKIVQAFSPVGK